MENVIGVDRVNGTTVRDLLLCFSNAVAWVNGTRTAMAWPANPAAPLELAALSRELAVNDPQRDAETATTDGKRGTALDRNVELLVRAPFPVSA